MLNSPTLLLCLLATLIAAPALADPGWERPAAVDSNTLRAVAGLSTAGFEHLPAGSVHRIEAHLERFEHGQSLDLPLPDGERVAVGLRQTAAHPGGHRSLQVQSPNGGSVTGLVTVGPAGLYGQISTGSGRFRVHTDAGGTWLLHLDDPRIRVDQGCDANEIQDPFAHAAATPASRDSHELVQIDKMIIYTQDVADRYPGSLIETRVHHLIALTNQAMVDAELDIVLRLVNHEPTHYDRAVSSGPALFDMRNALRGEPVQGFENLAATRAEYGADLIAMLWAADIETRGACGVAFLPSIPDGEDEYDPSNGVQISADGITNWSVCSDSTFVHEVGHQLGANHNRESFGNQPLPPDARYFALLRHGRFNTVMSSISSADVNRYKRLNVYSNPSIQCGGEPCGSDAPEAAIDNASVMAFFAPVVADYMSSVVPGQVEAPPPSFPDSDGDGVNDWADPFPFDPLNGTGPEPAPPVPWQPLPRFPGDELDHWELLVVDSASDRIHAWMLDGEYAGLLVQTEPDPFPDERPAFSEYTGLEIRDDGLIYALAVGDVRRYSRLSGAEHDVFLSSQPPEPGQPAQLTAGFPKALAFNHDQSVLTISNLNLLESYNPQGERIGITGVPAPPPGQGFVQPHAVRSLVFDSEGSGFFVVEALTRRVLHYTSPTDFEPRELDQLDPDLVGDPWAITRGPGGFLFLANGSVGNILRLRPESGQAHEFIAPGSGGLSFARDLKFGPDGHLYVLDRDQAAVLRYDGDSGAFMDFFIAPDATELLQAEALQFNRRPALDIFSDRFEAPSQNGDTQ